MSNETVKRIVTTLIVMALFAIAGVAVGLQPWMFVPPLVWIGGIGLAAPKLGRAWARSRLPGSGNYRSIR